MPRTAIVRFYAAAGRGPSGNRNGDVT
jgi:hypothetical protein